MAFGLEELIGGVGNWLNNLGKGTVNMLGSGVAGVRDLGAMITGNYKGGNDSETAKWQMFMTGADNARDAQLKSAGQALNSATSLSDIALALGTGGTSKALTSGIGAVATNALQGAAGGFADELVENGENWSTQNAGKRMAAGMASGAVTAGLGNTLNSAAGKSGSKLLNNKFTQSAFGRGALSGATGGAVGGGMMAALSGGDLGDIFGTALSTGAAGGITGGVTSSLMNGASKLGDKAINKIWTAEQNQSFQNAISNPNKVKSPIYLGEVSDDNLGNIKAAYKNAGIDLDANPDAINAVSVQDGKLYLTQEGAQHLNQRRIVKGGMSAKQVRQTMRNATQNGTVLPNLSEGGNATMGALTNSKRIDIAHLGAQDDGSLELRSTYPVSSGKTYKDAKNTLDGSLVHHATDTNGDSLAAGASALQGDNSNISQQKQNVNSETPESYQGKNLRLKSAEALLDQYGTIDKPMARSADALENVQRVADAGFTKPGEVEDIINKVTGANGKVSKMTRTMVSTAQPVDTVTDINRMIDEQIDLNGLNGLPEGNAAKKYVEAQLNRLESRRKGTITGLDDPNDVFDVVKALEKRSAELRGKSGNNYRTTSAERGDAANFIDNINEVLKDRLYSGTDVSKVLTAENAAELKSFAPKNQKWADYVDNTIMKARDISELRSTMAPFVNMGKVIDNQYMNYGTYGSQMSHAAKTNRNLAGKLADLPVVGKIAAPIVELTLNSNAADRARAGAYAKAADVADGAAARKITSSTGNMNTGGGSATTVAQNINDSVATANLPSVFYNMLGRETGGQQANQVLESAANGTANNQTRQMQALQTLAGMQEQLSVPMPTYRLDDGMEVTLEEVGDALQEAANAGDVMAYNQLGQIYTALQSAQSQGVTGVINNTMSGNATDNGILAQLQQAAYLALMNGDTKSFSSLASLYESAKKMYGTDDKVELSSADKSTLQNLNNSIASLDQLEALYTAAGGGKGFSGNLDNIANFFTNGAANYNLSTYNSAKESLGMAIVKNFVNLGATESDAKRYAAMLPEITDTQEMAQQKLTTLRSLIQQAQRNVYAQY